MHAIKIKFIIFFLLFLATVYLLHFYVAVVLETFYFLLFEVELLLVFIKLQVSIYMYITCVHVH